MFRPFALTLAALVCVADVSSADVIFSGGPIQTNNSGGTLPSVQQLLGVDGSGRQFINGYNSAVGDNNVFGNTQNFTALGSNNISSYVNSGIFGTTNPYTYNNSQVVAVFAANGSSPNPAQISLTQGVVALFVAGSNYNSADPTTWGILDGSGNFSTANMIASWKLIPGQDSQNDVNAAGGPFAPRSAGDWNSTNISFNITDNNIGFFLFEELNNPDFWNAAPNTLNGPEGLGVRVNEVFQPIPDGTGFPSADFLSQADEAWLGLMGLGGYGDLSGFGFATGTGGVGNTGGPSSDYNPASGFLPGPPDNVPNTSDSVFTLGVRGGIWYQPGSTTTEVPEPATMALVAGMMGIGGVVYRRRKVKTA